MSEKRPYGYTRRQDTPRQKPPPEPKQRINAPPRLEPRQVQRTTKQ